MFTKENDYGCTKAGGVSDMDKNKLALEDALEKNGIRYTVVQIPMAVIFSPDPCQLFFYTTRSGVPMTVLVVPQSGADSWAESYYYFPYMTPEVASAMDWYEVYKHVHDVYLETLLKKTKKVQYCPKCKKPVIEFYEDIRGRNRCTICHSLTTDKKDVLFEEE